MEDQLTKTGVLVWKLEHVANVEMVNRLKIFCKPADSILMGLQMITLSITKIPIRNLTFSISLQNACCSLISVHKLKETIQWCKTLCTSTLYINHLMYKQEKKTHDI